MRDTLNSIPLIVGDGRLARHWKHYLTLENLPYIEWARTLSSQSFAEFVAPLKSRISCVYLLVSDAAIEPFYLEHKATLPESTPWCHASGALTVAGVLDAHPLMTFSHEFYELERYRAISVVSASPLKSLQQTLLRGLSNKLMSIKESDKALYHALCVLGGAGTGALWSFLEREWASVGVSKDAWHPYQKQVFENLYLHGKKAITGPWGRGDVKTTEKNQKSLRSDDAKNLYGILKGIHDEYGQH